MSVNTNLKHFEKRLSVYQWGVWFKLEFAYLWLKHDHVIYTCFNILHSSTIICAYVLDLLTWILKFMLCLFLKLNGKIGHKGVDDRCRVMFVGIVLVSPHETITRPLGWSRGLKACVTC